MRRRIKIRRKELCPCGSGKKYKKCCGSVSRPPQSGRRWSIGPIRPEMMNRIMEHQRQEKERIRRYGEVRPEVAADFKNYKFVAVGGKLYYSKRWKFFPDFLIDYVPQVFGREWFEREIAKGPDERQPLMQWRVKGIQYLKKHQKTEAGGANRILPNGFVAAYLSFAYDLYVVEHNARLDERLLQRLKHPDQFQGARHELFAEATCLRAGFNIEHENETDVSKRHAEFAATHKATGEKISVEAKSRHRPGVLGQPGTPQEAEEMNLRFGQLLNDAVAKNVPHPLVLFLDTNLPAETADRLFAFQPTTPPIPPAKILAMLDRIQREHGGRDPINLMIFTNHPHHYSKQEEVDPRKHILSVLSTLPVKSVEHPEALVAVSKAAELYGNIPNEFERPPEAVEEREN